MTAADAREVAGGREALGGLIALITQPHECSGGWTDSIEVGCAVSVAANVLAAGWKSPAQVEAALVLHAPVEVEPSATICAECSFSHGTGEKLRFFPLVEWPCPTYTALTTGAGE